MSECPRGEVPERLLKSHRLFQLASLLRERERTVRDLVLTFYPSLLTGTREWAAAERAIQRDLNDLALLEADLKITRTRPPRYHLPSHRNELHPTEALLLHAAARALYHRSSGELRHHHAALKRLSSWLPDHLRAVLDRGFSDLGEKRRRGRETQNLEKAAAAWLGAHPLTFEYQKPGGSGAWRTNIVEPYLIELHPQNLELYLIGRETSFHRDVRTFKLSRMRALQVRTSERYEVPGSFDPRAFFHSALGVVGTQGRGSIVIRLRFRQDAAYRILEGGYSHLNDVMALPGGYAEAVIEAAPDSSGLPREVLAWIYSFGPRVEVLEPPELRAHWLSELREACAEAPSTATRDVGTVGEDGV